jgi:acetyl esterase/lipase
MRSIPLLLISGLLLSLCACSGAQLINFTVPHSGYAITRDIAYGDNPSQRLDIYQPATPDASGAVVVFFHGGSWQSGSRADYKFVGQALASRGYTVVIPDYRLYPEVKYPEFLRDSAKAVAWVHDHIGEYHANPGHIVLAGHSAGAYNAVMLALDGSYLKAAGYDAKKLDGVIGLAGPYDFLPFTDPEIIKIFSTAPDRDTQPITYAGAGKPPLLLLHGDADEDVGLKNSKNLAAAQQQSGSPVELHVFPGIGHYGIILSLSGVFRSKAATLDLMDAFISRHANP